MSKETTIHYNEELNTVTFDAEYAEFDPKYLEYLKQYLMDRLKIPKEKQATVQYTFKQ